MKQWNICNNKRAKEVRGHERQRIGHTRECSGTDWMTWILDGNNVEEEAREGRVLVVVKARPV